MADTSLRRKLTLSAALGLLLVPGCHTVEQNLPYAETIQFSPDALEGLATRTVSVQADHSTVSYRYPVLGESHPLTTEVRTRMAEHQTAFLEGLPDSGKPELAQDVEILAASEHVLGARITATTSGVRDAGTESSTLWYDTASQEILPWTALFQDEESLEVAHLAVADVLQDGYRISAEQLPGLVGEIAVRAEADPDSVSAAASEPAQDTEDAEGTAEGTEEPEGTEGPDSPAASRAPAAPEEGKDEAAPLVGDADLGDPEQAWEAAERWSASPLADLAFSTAGGLAVRMDPAVVPSAGRISEILLPVEPETAEEVLSELGYQARSAAVTANADPEDFPFDGTLTAEGTTLDCQRLKCVALTFDDGPGEHTEELLDHMAEYEAKGTFYVLGSLVAEFPEIVGRTHAEGHEMGNHTWKHDDLTTLSADGVAKDLERTDKAIEKVTGELPATLRPPYGALNGTVRSATPHPIILWDVDTMDWQSRDTAAVAKHALEETVPGSVVLFHDIHKSSVDAIPDVLDGLHRDGYHFVTVSDIFGLDGMDPGEVHTDARPN
ncbi:polysaccharide deacetylase family protein [Nocardiopsis metallicus]|uniref:Peptidoglycan/xylan/chitin deacetylase (PgdA/CDA1 family) n=1 Tax=Nocardiopsis metallicus TaxID=179819 RepID=A0A840WFJ7_9ACTN|nr:polysaccharide deacetylase family protein [Nocardiopsis metallicus]MBB5490497.1 peptidoglycan/xylan/chitin deacetylase (PgdA/CDA1 family) [Nocardiopsis metallicus]